MPRNPLVLLHGYHDVGAAYINWREGLEKRGVAVQDINICNYVTLNNEITIDDIAEGFERGLRAIDLADKQFDAIVHSTGMLVIRAWLTAPNATTSRIGRLKRLIALAPATFGSPLAAKGRSLLGRIFKGNRQIGPDFLESGDLVLSDLELASSYTWNLAHRDLIDTTAYGADKATPYVFVFAGTDNLGRLAEIFDRDDQVGTDGVVRWSGVPLNTRKLTVDLSHPGDNRIDWSAWNGIDIPLIPVDGVNHCTILAEPPEALIDLVNQALQVESQDDFAKVHQAAENTDIVKAGRTKLAANPWQQFVVHAVDSRGNPITDYAIEVHVRSADGTERTLAGFEEDVHPFSGDSSYRCFHVQLGDVTIGPADRLHVRVIASTGTELVGYQGYALDAPAGAKSTFGPVDIDITSYAGRTPGELSFFYPFTTTLIEIRLNREPIPLAGTQPERFEIFEWLDRE